MTVGHRSDGVHEVEVMECSQCCQSVGSLRSSRSDGPRSLLKQDPVLAPHRPDPAFKSVRGLQEDDPLVARDLEGQELSTTSSSQVHSLLPNSLLSVCGRDKSEDDLPSNYCLQYIFCYSDIFLIILQKEKV